METMEQLTCEIRYSKDESRQTPGRVTGTLIVYEKRAGDRPELFERGAIHWPEKGIVINEMHQRNTPVLRVIPFLDGDELRIDGVLPDTQRGRDAATKHPGSTSTPAFPWNSRRSANVGVGASGPFNGPTSHGRHWWTLPAIPTPWWKSGPRTYSLRRGASTNGCDPHRCGAPSGPTAE